MSKFIFLWGTQNVCKVLLRLKSHKYLLWNIATLHKGHKKYSLQKINLSLRIQRLKLNPFKISPKIWEFSKLLFVTLQNEIFLKTISMPAYLMLKLAPVSSFLWCLLLVIMTIFTYKMFIFCSRFNTLSTNTICSMYVLIVR